MGPDEVPFPGPGAGELEHVVVTVGQVELGTQGPVKGNRFTMVRVGSAPDNHVFLLKDRVVQFQEDVCQLILEFHRQGLGIVTLVVKAGWQVSQALFAVRNLVTLVGKL